MVFPGPCNKLKNLLIGQSFLVVLCSFTIAQLTTFDSFHHKHLPIPLSYIIPNESFLFYVMIQSGLPGVVTTVISAQLLPSILAKEYPLHCLNLMGIYSTVRLALLIENIGIVKLVYSVVYGMDKIMFSTYDQQKEHLSELELEEDAIPSLDCRSPGVKRDPINQPLDRPPSPTVLTVPRGVFSGTHSRIIPTAVPKSTPYVRCVQSDKEVSLDSTTSSQSSPVTGSYTVIKDRLQLTMSVLLTTACVVFAVYCTSKGYSVMSDMISIPIQVLAMAGALTLVFYCEGLKIAVVSTAHLPPHSPSLRDKGPSGSSTSPLSSRRCCGCDGGMGEEDSDGDEDVLFTGDSMSRAEKVHSLLCAVSGSVVNSDDLSLDHEGMTVVDSSNDGRQDNVKRFLLGRQMMVVPMGFLVAQLTHYSGFPRGVSWMPPYLYFPIVTVGIPGVLILLQFAQLTPQLLAENKPVRFMGMIGCYSIAYTALCIETIGITDSAWALYKCVEVLFRPVAESSDDGGNAVQGAAGDDATP